MASKQVIERQKSTRAVAATVDTYAERLRLGFGTAVTGAVGDAEQAPDVVALVQVIARTLDRSIDRLVERDETHALELADDAGLREARDKANLALREHLVGLREGLVGMYGATAPGAMGLRGRTPDDPTSLVRFGREVARALREKALPAPRYKTARIDPAAEATALDELAKRLEAALEALAEDARQNVVTRTARDAAMAEHDKSFSRTATLLSAMFDFAGEPELADRIRPSIRSPGRLATEPEPEAPPSPGEPPPNGASEPASSDPGV